MQPAHHIISWNGVSFYKKKKFNIFDDPHENHTHTPNLSINYPSLIRLSQSAQEICYEWTSKISKKLNIYHELDNFNKHNLNNGIILWYKRMTNESNIMTDRQTDRHTHILPLS